MKQIKTNVKLKPVYLSMMLLLSFLFIFSMKNISAAADETEPEPIVCFDLETEDGLFLGTKAEGPGWSYDGEYTLYFDNYTGKLPESKGKKVIPNITINAKDAIFYIDLKGENYWPGEIWIDHGALNISGSGSLSVENNILINRTTYYDYDGEISYLPEDEVFTGALTTDLFIKDFDGSFIDVNALSLIKDGMQHYDIYGPLQFLSPSEVLKTPAKAKIISVKSNAKTKFTVKFKNKEDVAGYEIIYSTDKNLEQDVTVVDVTSKKSTITRKIGKLTSGEKYYVRVRAYNLDPFGQKVYGKYSSRKSVTIK